MKFILASASPRRREILSHLGLDFSVLCADADESSEEKDGAALVEILSLRKAHAVRDRMIAEGRDVCDVVILASDTVVVSPDGEILGKPRDRQDAIRMLRSLSGRAHAVISGLAVWTKDKETTSHEVTQVTFMPLEDSIIERYVDGGEPMDKAGAYGAQGKGALFVRAIEGDFFNVMGLPVCRLGQMLAKKGVPIL